MQIVCWNIRGLSDRKKRVAIFDTINRHMPGIVCLLETHLDADSVKVLRKRWVAKEYHSLHTSFSRGVSILIHKRVECEIFNYKIDRQGRYIFLHMKMGGKSFVLAAMYIPPPFSLETLRHLVVYLEERAESSVLLVGDFNCVLDEDKDRWRLKQVDTRGTSPLLVFLREMTWVDFWRSKNPEGRSYSCYNKTKQTLSRIDMALGSKDLVPWIRNVSYEQRSISDHAPVQIRLRRNIRTRRLKINTYILTEEAKKVELTRKMQDFFELNRGSSSVGMTWDAFKAVTRGCLLEMSIRDRRQLAKTEEVLRTEIQIASVKFGETGLPEDKEAWEEKEEKYKDLIMGNAQTRIFFQDRCRYMEGGRPGKFLARLMDGEKGGTIISAVRDRGGGLKTDIEDICKEFVEYYKTLYSSQCVKEIEEIGEYIESCGLPRLSEEAAKGLEADITLEEILRVIRESPNGKAAGLDALPFEFYKAQQDLLAPELLKIYERAEGIGRLPPSMYRALLTLILKPGKDECDPGSYRPISLLNVDQKILAKILTNRLAKVIPEIIVKDQTGFMSGCTTSNNIRRLYANIMSRRGGCSILSLDAVKAFDRVEWPFLWKVLESFGFGARFIGWLKVLYKEPKSVILINGHQSEEFCLSRGTRQGCPLSPLIFALYIEPLAVKLRSEGIFEGFGCGGTEDRLSLYADDILLYIKDASKVLGEVIKKIEEFGLFSGLEINWNKSILMPMGESVQMQGLRVLKEGESFKYLGIEISTEVKSYTDLNIKPLLQKIRRKCNVWMGLPTTMMDRVSLVKMFILPQVLYVLRNSPIWIGKKVFKQLKAIISGLVWRARKPRIKMDYLCRNIEDGGLGIPDFEQYFILSQLGYLVRWRDNKYLVNMVLKNGEWCEDIWEWIEAGPQDRNITELEGMYYKVWVQFRKLLGIQGSLDFTLLFNNIYLEEFVKLKDYKFWRKYRLVKVSQFIKEGSLRGFDELQAIYHIPSSAAYKYMQLKHALEYTQNKDRLKVHQSHVINTLRGMDVNKKVLSKLYRGVQKVKLEHMTHKSEQEWEQDLGIDLCGMWHSIWRWAKVASINKNHCVSQVFCLKRLYITPKMITKFKKGGKKVCPKCGMEEVGFFHMIYECRPVRQFWHDVDTLIGERLNIMEVGGLSVKLLGNMNELGDRLNRRVMNKIYFIARLVIAKNWMSESPPCIKQVLNKIRQVINYEYGYCVKISNLGKFYSGWSRWIDGMTDREKMGLIQSLRC